MRIVFRGNKIWALGAIGSEETDITDLVSYLKQFSLVTFMGGKTYEDVPDRLYNAWKILVLGTFEYRDIEYQLVRYSALNLEEWKAG